MMVLQENEELCRRRCSVVCPVESDFKPIRIIIGHPARSLRAGLSWMAFKRRDMEGANVTSDNMISRRLLVLLFNNWQEKGRSEDIVVTGEGLQREDRYLNNTHRIRCMSAYKQNSKNRCWSGN